MKPEVIDLFNKGATVNNAGYPITYMAPGTFDGLKDKNNNKLDPTYVNQNGTGNQPFNVLANFYGGTVFAYLTTTVIGGAGTASNPYIGAPTSLAAGDELAIEGSGISDPTVTGPAASPSDGGWVVDSYTSNYVIFRDTQSVTFNPLALISGFDYDSTGPVIGQEWFVTSSVLGSGSLGSVEAVPESSTWAMMMAGFAGLGLIGCRAARKTATAA